MRTDFQRRRVATPIVALLVGALALPGAAAAAPSPTPSSTAPHGTTPSSAHSVPPAAPKPTDSGRSPAAPDPHPPRGGIGPEGEAVGGARLLSRGLVLPRGAPPLPRDLTARSWVLADLDTGDILAARDPHGRYQAASIQKLLTSITLLPLLPGTRRVTVDRRSANTEGSHAGLVAGGTYTVDDLFRGLLLVSGNDAAEALAEAAGGRAATVARMNRTAVALGADDTYVQTPSGLDGWQQLTSAYDMSLFLRAAVRAPRFVRYDTARTATLPAQRSRGFGRIRLFNQNLDFLDAVPGALVAKTGFTDAAQHTFAGAIRRHGHRYGVILLRAQRYPDDQYVQATKLVKWGLALKAGTPPVGHLDVAPVTRTSSPRVAADRARPVVPAESAAPGSSDTARHAAVIAALAVLGLLTLLTVRMRLARLRP